MVRSQCGARGAVAFAGLLAATGAWASASSRTILEYSFPISWSGSGVVADLSPAGNNGTVAGSPAVSTLLPAGGIGRSLTTNSGGVLTSAATELQLLSNNTVANYGGFSLETWFRWDGTSTSYSTQKIIDYAGTESLQLYNPGGANQTAGEQVQFAFNGATDAADAISFAVSPNTWYHALATFNAGGHSVAADGSLAGVATFSLDTGSSPSTGTLGVSKTNAGDALDRPIGVGILGLSGNNLVNFHGQVYLPTVSLGVVPGEPIGVADGGWTGVVPEPASAGVVAWLVAPLLLGRRRRHRRRA